MRPPVVRSPGKNLATDRNSTGPPSSAIKSTLAADVRPAHSAHSLRSSGEIGKRACSLYGFTSLDPKRGLAQVLSLSLSSIYQGSNPTKVIGYEFVGTLLEK